MAKYRITSPDGSVHEITAPDTASQADVMAVAQSAGILPAAQKSQPATAPAQQPGASKAKGGILGGLVMGARDFVDGGAQLLRRAVPDSVGNAVDSVGNALADMGLPVARSKGVAGVDNIVTKANTEYDQSRAMAGRSGFDGARMAGGVAASLPMVVTGGAGLGARAFMAKNALAGAAMGGAQPVVDAGDGYWGQKAGQVATGAAAGALIPAAVNAISKPVGSAIRAGKNALANISNTADNTAQISAQLQQLLAKKGIDFAKLTDQAKAALMVDAKKAFDLGAELPADQLARKAAILKVGATPTKGAVSREPGQWANERNMADIDSEAGRLLKSTHVNNNQALIDSTAAAQKATGGKSPNDYQAGQGLVDALGEVSAAQKQKIAGLYDTARNAAGVDAPLNAPRLFDKVSGALDDAYIGDKLPASLRKALGDFADGKAPLTLGKAEQIRRAASGMYGSDPVQNKALGVLKGALDDEVALTTDAMGGDAAQAFKAARGAHSEWRGIVDKTPALQALEKGVEPDKFVQKFIVDGNKAHVESLGNVLKEHPQAWNDARSQVVSFISKKAGVSSSGEGMFSGNGFQKALDQLGDDKLKVLFKPDELEALKSIADASNAITKTPAFAKSAIGSNTAEKAFNLLSRFSNVPYLKQLIDPVRAMAKDRAIKESLTGSIELPKNALVGSSAKPVKNALSVYGTAAVAPSAAR